MGVRRDLAWRLWRVWTLALAGFAALASGCVSVPVSPDPAPAAPAAPTAPARAPGERFVLCQGQAGGAAVTVHAGFDRARASSCSIAPDGTLDVLIEPETRPVNDSAWYAFQIETDASVWLRVALRYEGGRHRYHPKLSTDGSSWTTLDPAALRVAASRQQADLDLALQPGVTTIAGQPLETAAQALARWDRAVAAGQLVSRPFGTSVRGVPLIALSSPAPQARRTLVLLARQHPPETTGAAAFDAFLERFLEDDPVARAFRAQVELLVIPVMNPDGLTAGHWRTNANGIDLNRDWGIGSQPETRAAATLIEQAHAAKPLIGLVDFHSTRRDVIYAMPAEDPLDPPGVAEDWFARWAARAGPAAPPIDRSFDADQMNSKTWSRLRFGLSAVTYEVGDNTPPEQARATARLSAEAYLDALMAMLAQPSGAAF